VADSPDRKTAKPLTTFRGVEPPKLRRRFGLPESALRSPDIPPPYRPQVNQSLEERVAALSEFANQLRDVAVSEAGRREQIVEAMRATTDELVEAIDGARQELKGLSNLTAGSPGLRWLGVPLLMIGVAFTTWEKPIAERWPSWLTGNRLIGGLLILTVLGLCMAVLREIERDRDAPVS
jgi:hypothetical protein